MYKLFYILIATHLINLIIKTYIGSLFLNNNYFSLNVNVPTLRTIYILVYNLRTRNINLLITV